MKYCFIVNPTSGGGLAGRNWPVLRDMLPAAGIDSSCHFTQSRGHGIGLARRAYEAGQRNFVAVGGDGTANEVLNGLLAACGRDTQELSLGVVPWGTGNDWARYYGFSPAPEDCVKMLKSGNLYLQDIGRVTLVGPGGASRTRHFLNCAGTGLDSYLLGQMQSAGGSRSRYLVHVLKCLFKYRAARLRLDMEGELLEELVLLLEVCVGKYAGAGMRFAPAASADDGIFEVLVVEDMSAFRLLRSLPVLYNGGIRQHPAVKSRRCRNLSVAARTTQYLHCDGELAGQLPARIEIMPRVLRVLVPPSGNDPQ